MMNPKLITDPLAIEIAPGKAVRDLKGKDECNQAVFQIDMDMESIAAQIARAEADPSSVEPGWRTRSQTAIRWKKRARKAVVDFARQFEPPRPPAQRRYAAILDAIRQELGNDEFEFMMLKAKERHPKAFGGGDDV